jgi:SET domain-containing protein
MDYDTDEIYVQAVRDIEAGEELTINYNATWNDESKVWFDVVE